MIEATIRLLRSQGLNATGINDILAASKAQRGSIYFHFPGGKEQLAVEALRTAGATVSAKIRSALNAERNTTTALRRYVSAYAREIRESDYQRGCPVGNVAMDAAATSPRIREACASIFADWQNLIADRLKDDGVAPKEALRLSEFILSALEGALILCRARRSTEPLDQVADQLAVVLAGRSKRTRRR